MIIKVSALIEKLNKMDMDSIITFRYCAGCNDVEMAVVGWDSIKKENKKKPTNRFIKDKNKGND